MKTLQISRWYIAYIESRVFHQINFLIYLINLRLYSFESDRLKKNVFLIVYKLQQRNYNTQTWPFITIASYLSSFFIILRDMHVLFSTFFALNASPPQYLSHISGGGRLPNQFCLEPAPMFSLLSTKEWRGQIGLEIVSSTQIVTENMPQAQGSNSRNGSS